MKQLFIVVALALSLSGCAGVFSALDRFRPVGEAILNTAETTHAIVDIRTAYIDARNEVQLNRDIFTDPEWAILEDGNRTIEALAVKINELKARQGGIEIVLTSNELISLILPARDSATSIMTVIDSHFLELPDSAQRSYLTVIEDYGRIDGELQRVLAEGNNRARADMLIDLLDMVARILGVMSIGLA